MGFFSKNAGEEAGASASALAPLSKDRIKKALEAQDWSYGVDEDGDIGGGWEYGSFYFFVNGKMEELLCVRGAWRGQLEASQYAEAIEVCNNWNAEKLWPKTYARLNDEGFVRIMTEHNVDYEFGISDEQLSQHLLCALNTSMSFFESVIERFP